MNKRRALAIIFFVLILVVSGVTFETQRRTGPPAISLADRRAAEAVVTEAIIAVRDDDVKALLSMLYSESADRRVAHSKRKIRFRCAIAATRQKWNLLHITEADISRSVKADTVASGHLVTDVLQCSSGDYERDWHYWAKAKPVMVRYVIRDVPMVSVALQEGREWKIAAIPCDLSANILRYNSLSEANEHGDALAEPPCEEQK